MVGIVMAAERISRIENILRLSLRADGKVQMMLCHKFLHVRGAHIFLLFRQGILDIEPVDAQLVGHHHICLVRHSSGNPVMSADGFQPPDFIHILESNAIHLVSTVLFQQAAQALYTFPSVVNIRKH